MLAAGKGKRFGPLSASFPKPLLPVLDRPLILWQLEALASAGIGEVVLVIGHLGQRIVELLGDGRELGLHLRYVEQEEPLGIAHALLAAGPWLERPFACLLGDVFFEAQDLARLVRAFGERELDGLLAVRREEDPHELARNFSVELDELGCVRQLVEKPPPARGRLRGAGLYVFRPALLAAARATLPSAVRGEIELTDAIQGFVSGGARVRTLDLRGSDVNLSGPVDLLRANLRALELARQESFVAPDACLERGSSLEHSIVLGRARVAAGARLVRSLVLPGEAVAAGDYRDTLFAAGTLVSCASERR